MKGMRIIFIALFFMLLLPIKVSAAIDDTLPDDYFYFSGQGIMTNDAGVVQADLFKKILKGKQDNVINQMKTLGDNKFTSASVPGDLEGAPNTTLGVKGINGWSADLNKLRTNTFGSAVNMRLGSDVYTIYIPRGMKQSGDRMISVNQGVINFSIDAINKYKETVKEGILAGSMLSSYNVYSMYSSSQVLVGDILEDVKDANGKPTGLKAIKNTATGLNYSFDYFYNPLFGKVDATDLPKTDADWVKKIPEFKITVSSNNSVAPEINKDYKNFIDPKSVEQESITKIDKAAVTKAEGLKKYTATYAKVCEPGNMVDSAMRLILPKTFSKSLDGKYILTDENGYTVVPDTKLLIAKAFVTGVVSGKNQKLGEYKDYGLNDKSLLLYNVTVDNKKVGAVIPLVYKEAIVDTTEGNKVYVTNRTITFSNTFNGKIDFNRANKDIISLATKSETLGALPRNYGFAVDGKYNEKDAHTDIGLAPEHFDVNTIFDSSKTDLKSNGFKIFFNNTYIDDKDLVAWLETNDDLKDLYKKVIGTFGTDTRQLTYDEWKRLQEIKSELHGGLASQLMSLIRITAIIFGVFLFVYSICLILAYFMDIFNVLMEFSLLNLLTFRRLYPITSEEDLSYIQYSRVDVKYVKFSQVLTITLAGMFISLIFICNEPVIYLLFKVYIKIQGLIGGV